MAAAAVELLSDRERWSLFSKEARRRAETEFPTAKLVERYRAIYERTLGGN
jgi:glycosyltransferase involved in cell wall biosynthesis